MHVIPDYLDKNRHSWNERTSYHVASEFYDMDSFLQGKTTLKDTELYLLGDLTGKAVLHLQCHFGQDTISLARMGAAATGVDLSDKAIQEATKLAAQTGTDATFICCDVYDVPKFIERKFDVVFTSYGTIGWLPDLDKWAKVIAGSLKVGGRFIFVEFHPVIWMFNNEFTEIGYNYFNDGPILETEKGTYADREAPITTETVSWNHSISEVVNSLIQNGMELQSLDELNYSPYNCFSNTIEFEPGRFRIAHLGNKIPMVYALSAVKNKI